MIPLLTRVSVLRTVSICHLLFGANRSAANDICVVNPDLKSLSATSKNANSSRIMIRMFCSFIRA